MSEYDNRTGGSAFPVPRYVNDSGETHDSPGGMSLRDWFAGQYREGQSSYLDVSEVARLAYAYADAMLAERDKK